MMDISRFRLTLFGKMIFIDYCDDAAVQNFSDKDCVFFNCEGIVINANYSGNIMVDEL